MGLYLPYQTTGKSAYAFCRQWYASTLHHWPIPDGSHGFVSTDRRCKVSYDFPAHIRIEIQPTQAELQRSKQ